MSTKAIRNENKVELDVRDILERGDDPFQEIMQAVEMLQEGDKFVLHANFKPAPLLNVMKGKGYGHTIEQLTEKHFQITFTKE